MRKGFTLMEFLLTMCMLTIIALLFITFTGDVGNVAVDAASWKIQSDLRYAQQLAMSMGTTHGIAFVNGGDYTVYEGTVATPVIDPLKRTAMVVTLNDFGDVAVNTDLVVEFDAVGRPMQGGGDFVEVISSGGAARRVYITANTGAVIVDVLDYGSGCNCQLCIEEER